MYSVLMTAFVPGHGRDETFDTLADFARYAELVDAVREVEVLPPEPDGSLVSHWVVLFRKGLLRWSESDTFDRGRGVISFTQTDGDFDVFEGGWTVESAEDGAAVTFRAEFDFGVPSMAGIVDPVAGRVLLENLELILQGLFAQSDVRVIRAEHGVAGSSATTAGTHRTAG
ncbi:type II toxin-antitoxin system RatA family toxin [Allosalinactinospora lopnorensis]|uniref:type II toxin-antitoxin system RatA family toxin n=1 Tax=Allosalinactinospora lopnorensis TaxID=1352348 RepID=UPI0009E3931D|nr:SRPBCC family protein [Allosalinactinospora lopnorensis]